MKLCKYCQEALDSHGEHFRVIKYYGYGMEDEECKCDWCGDTDVECDEVQFD